MTDNEELGFLNINDSLYQTRISWKFKNRIQYKPADPRIVVSIIPGTILEIFVQTGQHVMKGDSMLIVDAMKMQNRIKSSIDGKVKSISVKSGDKVSKGTVLVELE